MESTSVSGRVALVTGGQRGIGAAFADELLRRGARRVYVTGRSPRASDDPRLVPLQLEVTDAESISRARQAASDVSILVNNAGIDGGGPLLSGPAETGRRMFDTNVIGTPTVTHAFAPALQQRKGAMIMMLSALSWASGAGAYGATKAALWSLTNSLRLEFAPDGVAVIGVHVGFVDTDLTAGSPGPKLPPEVVAKAALDALEAGEPEPGRRDEQDPQGCPERAGGGIVAAPQRMTREHRHPDAVPVGRYSPVRIRVIPRR